MTDWPRWMSHTTVCRYVDAGKRRLRTMMQNGFPKGNLIGGKMHWDRNENEHLEEQKASMRQIAYSDIWERAEVLWLDDGGHPGEFHAQDQQTIHEYLLAARADLDYERRAYKNPGDAAYDTLAEKKMDQE